MKIQYCSDLHLEFEQNRKWLKDHPLKVSGDILVLAGDIVPLHDEYLSDPFFEWISRSYRYIYWIPGNHEFYHRNINDFSASYEIKMGKNISVLHNKAIAVDGVLMVFSTLWSEIRPENEQLIEQNVSDFKFISNAGRRLKSADFNYQHRESLLFLKKTLKAHKGRVVVVTHHLPSAMCNADEHTCSPINEAFCVDLSDFIMDCGVSFWIYGHSHFNHKPLFLGKTIMLTNQLGYVQAGEQTGFRSDAYIVI